MTGELAAQLGFGAAFFSLIIFLMQATVRGTWRPKAWTQELLDGKDELLKLKDEQIVLLTADRDKRKDDADRAVEQNGRLIDALSAVEHFFRETPVVPSKGDSEQVGVQ